MKKQLLIKKNEDKRIRRGHLWVFSNEVKEIRGQPGAGDLAELCDHSGKFLGIGFYHPHSLIALRVLTTNDEPIDFHFFEQRLQRALNLRKRLYPSATTYRLVHGESDFLPGLVIDRYDKYLSTQTFSAGMDKRLTLICDAVESLLHPRGIVERNESPLRALEGLEERKGMLRGELSPLVVNDGDVKYEVDLLEGQKTGLFLDQRENRFAVRPFSKGARVLDCFCNDGGFALHSARGGAKEVTGVDSSGTAISRSARNAVMNAVSDKTRFVESDVFGWLNAALVGKKNYDLVILDPPSFTRNRRTVASARRGYREINENAIRLLSSGGILATASCSHHVSRDFFQDIIAESAQNAGRAIRILQWRGASPDHPTLPAMPETEYLKFALVQVE